MVFVESDRQPSWRQRRAHRKSRHGCRNCKLRRVKCDETKPRCARCRSYGVICDYAGRSPDLQLTQELKMPPLVAADVSSSIELDEQCLARLARFECRTIGTAIHVPARPLVQRAIGSPYLMHAILAFTETHDRYLNRRAPTAPGTRELYHASRSSSLFSWRLARPIQPDDRDTIWATATFLGILAFTSVSPVATADCWPLRPAELSWLCLSTTKRALWKLTNPLRPDSLFHDMSEEYVVMYSPHRLEPDGDGGVCCPHQLSILPDHELLADLCHLCGLQYSLACSMPPLADDSPYQEAFNFLRGLYAECVDTRRARSYALVFISQMQPDFIQLLRARDPVALVLLALWYERAGRWIWWIRYRALVEGPAICLYLRRYGKHDPTLWRVLEKGWDWEPETPNTDWRSR